jgi:hypothetical protein
MQLVRKSLSGLNAAAVASANTVETRVARNLQSDLSALDDKLHIAPVAPEVAGAAAIDDKSTKHRSA